MSGAKSVARLPFYSRGCSSAVSDGGDEHTRGSGSGGAIGRQCHPCRCTTGRTVRRSDSKASPLRRKYVGLTLNSECLTLQGLDRPFHPPTETTADLERPSSSPLRHWRCYIVSETREFSRVHRLIVDEPFVFTCWCLSHRQD
jgi:hypothetical protein